MSELADRLDAPPLFIVGIPRSGTTWVYDVLGAHELVCTVFESGLFDSGRGFGGVLSDAAWRWNPKSDKHVAPRERVVAELRTAAINLFMHHMQPEHRYLAEKTPGHVLALPVLNEVFPESRIVHVLRDGRDVAVSSVRATETWAKGRWRRVPPPKDVAVVARRWASAITATTIAKDLLPPDRFLEMRYEDLHDDPKGQITRLLGFAGIAGGDEIVARLADATDFASSGRSQDTTGFYRGGRVGDWRTAFTLADAAAFNAVGGEALIAAGYEQDRRWRPDGVRVRRKQK